MPQSTSTVMQILDPRTHLRRLPLPYNEASTPYLSNNRDFSPLVRYELDAMPPRKMLKLTPCKVILIGDCSVGKTAILNRFCYDKFQSNYKATIGVDFEIENFNILGQNFSLEMWDTAGQERFKCIAGAYYRNANVVVVAFDMSKRETLDSARRWLSTALKYNSTTVQTPLIFLVGTKSDLLTKEEFIRMERLASNVAAEMKAEYWSVSARCGFKVLEFFQRMACLAFEEAVKRHISIQKPQKMHNNRETIASSIKLQKSDNFDFLRHFNGRQWRSESKQKSGCAC